MSNILLSLLVLSLTSFSLYSKEPEKKPAPTPDSKSLEGDTTSQIKKDEEPRKPVTDNDLKVEQQEEIKTASKEMFGTDPNNKFSLYQPTYFIFGEDDLKLQFSGKYRVARSYDLYLAFTQTMFWSIYEDSAPFDDINYNPEIFYRVTENPTSFLRSIDVGVLHTSNGENGDKSRSINRYYVKTNLATNLGRHNILGEFKLQNIYSESQYNEGIKDHLGFWDIRMIITHVIVWGTTRLDFEYRVFSGKKVFNIDQGGRELGLLYHLGTENFNPAFYFQYYSGYAENLLHYNDKQSRARLGLMLFF